MYQEYFLTLPGGLQLPFGIAVEEVICYSTLAFSRQLPEQEAAEAAQSYLLQQMLSGRIVQSAVRTLHRDGVLILNGHYICNEMIGIVKHEEIIEHYGK